MDMWKSSEHAHLREEEEHFAESFDCDRIFKVSAKTGNLKSVAFITWERAGGAAVV